MLGSEGDPASLLNYVAIELAVANGARLFLINVPSSVPSEICATSGKVNMLQYQLQQLQEDHFHSSIRRWRR